MNVEVYNIRTGMGEIVDAFPAIDFLTDDESVELDRIGYTGTNLKGERTTYQEYLNSLNKGEFKVRQTKYDNGDFTEKFEIIRIS